MNELIEGRLAQITYQSPDPAVADSPRVDFGVIRRVRPNSVVIEIVRKTIPGQAPIEDTSTTHMFSFPKSYPGLTVLKYVPSQEKLPKNPPVQLKLPDF